MSEYNTCAGAHAAAMAGARVDEHMPTSQTWEFGVCVTVQALFRRLSTVSTVEIPGFPITVASRGGRDVQVSRRTPAVLARTYL